jgi:Xaa-Pro dipeptidase
VAIWRLSGREFNRRIDELKRILVRRKLDAAYLTSLESIFYFTEFAYIPTERPAAFIIPVDGEITYMGPIIEQDHIQSRTKLVTSIKVYRDYPGLIHPMDLFAQWLSEMGLNKKALGFDLLSSEGIWGYKGAPISQKLPNARFESIKDSIDEMRMFKSDEEIVLAKESAKWGNLAHTLLQEYTEPGLYDWEVSLKAVLEASRAMKRTLGSDYYPIGPRGREPVTAGFRGQVGPYAAFPHVMACPNPIRVGDVVVTGAGADVGGVGSELERTMVVGEPTEKQARFFNIMVEAQDAALELYRPGIKLSEIDKAVIAVFKKHDVLQYERHHTGHGLGSGIGHYPGHHPPFVDQGEEFIIQPRMSFSCEPGLFIPRFGGFRHADHIIITEDGSERITYYPRDIESLTIHCRK